MTHATTVAFAVAIVFLPLAQAEENAVGPCNPDFPNLILTLTDPKPPLRICSLLEPRKSKDGKSWETSAIRVVAKGELLRTEPWAHVRIENPEKQTASVTELISVSELGPDSIPFINTSFTCTPKGCVTKPAECLLKFKKGQFLNSVPAAEAWIKKGKKGDYSGILGRLLVRALDGDREAGNLLSDRKKHFHGSDGAEGDAENFDYIWSRARETGCLNQDDK